MIGMYMYPETPLKEYQSWTFLGRIGAILFGSGILWMTILGRNPSGVSRKLLIGSSIFLGFAAFAGTTATLQLKSAFHLLATAEIVEPVSFLNEFRDVEPLLYVSGLSSILASIGCAAASQKWEGDAKASHAAMMLSAGSFLILLVAMYLSTTREWWFAGAVTHTIEHQSVEPSAFAGAIVGGLLADLLTQLSFLGFAVAILWMAVTDRKTN